MLITMDGEEEEDGQRFQNPTCAFIVKVSLAKKNLRNYICPRANANVTITSIENLVGAMSAKWAWRSTYVLLVLVIYAAGYLHIKENLSPAYDATPE